MIRGRTLAKRKDLTRTLSRKPTNRITSKRMRRYEAITKKKLKHTKTKCHYKAKARL